MRCMMVKKTNNRYLPTHISTEELDNKSKQTHQEQYSKYFIDVSKYDKIDIYRYLELLSGNRGHAIEHAIKKLVLTGVRTGGKDFIMDVTEARNTLNRWLEMREEDTQ